MSIFVDPPCSETVICTGSEEQCSHFVYVYPCDEKKPNLLAIGLPTAVLDLVGQGLSNAGFFDQIGEGGEDVATMMTTKLIDTSRFLFQCKTAAARKKRFEKQNMDKLAWTLCSVFRRGRNSKHSRMPGQHHVIFYRERGDGCVDHDTLHVSSESTERMDAEELQQLIHEHILYWPDDNGVAEKSLSADNACYYLLDSSNEHPAIQIPVTLDGTEDAHLQHISLTNIALTLQVLAETYRADVDRRGEVLEELERMVNVLLVECVLSDRHPVMVHHGESCMATIVDLAKIATTDGEAAPWMRVLVYDGDLLTLDVIQQRLADAGHPD